MTTGKRNTSARFVEDEKQMAKAGDLIIQAAKAQAEGELAVHQANIEVYRNLL